jgi:hypothetical protein
MTLKGKTSILFCHIVSLSCSFFLHFIRLIMLCVIMGICESIVMFHNSEMASFALNLNCRYAPWFLRRPGENVKE